MTWDSLAATTLVLAVIIIARYFAIAQFFYWSLWKRDPTLMPARKLTPIRPPRGLIASEIRWSVIASMIYAVPGAIVIEAWKQGGTALYTEVGEFGWVYLFASIGLYLFIHDTYFYWTHRLMHRRKLFPILHKVHHQSRQPTPWAGFSFHPYESVIGAVILPVLVFLVPIHVGAVLFILVLMTVVSITNHSGFEMLPDSWLRGFVGRNWISAAHHNLHHQNFRCNFGLYFRFWDKVMGTDVMETAYDFSLPCRSPGSDPVSHRSGGPTPGSRSVVCAGFDRLCRRAGTGAAPWRCCGFIGLCRRHRLAPLCAKP